MRAMVVLFVVGAGAGITMRARRYEVGCATSRSFVPVLQQTVFNDRPNCTHQAARNRKGNIDRSARRTFGYKEFEVYVLFLNS